MRTGAIAEPNAAGTTVEPCSKHPKYRERIAYDPNGNILQYVRGGDAARLHMDSLQYSYEAGRNRLNKVVDAAPDAASDTYSRYNDIKQGQTNNNYQYDLIGNLVKDTQEGIDTIVWTVYGKIDSLHKTDGTGIRYRYDGTGNRIAKTVHHAAGGSSNTYYVRDAQGNVLSVYTDSTGKPLTQSEVYVYGSSRLGMVKEQSVTNDTLVLPDGTVGIMRTFVRGKQFFELGNHLSNVWVTISDKRSGVDSNKDGQIDYYLPQIASANDYYPFGMAMPGRNYQSGEYRYGFNGKENDKDAGEGVQDYGMRIYDSRIAKFLSVDPLTKDYPYYTPYQFAGNTPMQAIDLDGMEPAYVKEIDGKKTGRSGLTKFEITSTGDHFKVPISNHKDFIKSVGKPSKNDFNIAATHMTLIASAIVAAPVMSSIGGAPLIGQGSITLPTASFSALGMASLKGTIAGGSDLLAQNTLNTGQPTNWVSVGANFIGAFLNLNAFTTAAAASVSTRDPASGQMQLSKPESFIANTITNGVSSSATGNKLMPWHEANFSGLKDKAAAIIQSLIPSYLSNVGAGAAANATTPSSSSTEQNKPNKQ